jgi:hypothetical protein
MNWEPVNGYEGIYEVSMDGEIRTCEGKTTFTEHHGKRLWKQRTLKQKIDKKGYKRVTLFKNGSKKDFLVHRLVATAFCEQEEGKNIINHIDGDPGNNCYNNLEWCTHYENLMHAFLNKMNPTPIGVKLIHKETGEEHSFFSMAEAGKFLGHNHGYISGLLKKGKTETKTHKIFRVNE